MSFASLAGFAACIVTRTAAGCNANHANPVARSNAHLPGFVLFSVMATVKFGCRSRGIIRRVRVWVPWPYAFQRNIQHHNDCHIRGHTHEWEMHAFFFGASVPLYHWPTQSARNPWPHGAEPAHEHFTWRLLFRVLNSPLRPCVCRCQTLYPALLTTFFSPTMLLNKSLFVQSPFCLAIAGILKYS